MPKRILLSEAITSNADRLGLSRNDTFSTVTSVIQSSTVSIEDFFISPSTARRSRNISREKRAHSIEESFKLSVSNKCVDHWDSKLVKDFLKKEDRLAVLVSD